ncbi:methylenetetrahydrofolate--tRNA-(uracil(54)-C(5))-methyltransferase (FADH(2)-oxidizing) TrmFO [Sulfobacillus acidophilus]|uniref:Methylenetetrahydrofolate--tRNA-(uracil-5-)-methyltransferase TrmFO n=1 Tax=Sulfobacillus acidophilus TaxID=53633 RepID=A0ABS3AWW4_9FIRM|nr:methylenetetrahydrofolate--tRNA-(uracil(54)-C(5))-methyltransferase (FADH(2)-oxidizing) TrmFO [Sulfobacillus acidophilus]
MNKEKVRVVGAGLAGSEAALQLSKRGFLVELYEMKPKKKTKAQVSDHLAELVCSNSFRSNNPLNAVGLIKEEMRIAGGELILCADKAQVPAGDALAVDREIFSKLVEGKILKNKNITLIKDEVNKLFNDDIVTIVATGPLTSDGLAKDIQSYIGHESLDFYDAIAPIIDADSIDLNKAYFKSRYDKGSGDDYLNCPMTKVEYENFYSALIEADQAKAKEFENLHYFEGCLPIEELAKRGKQTLLFGPFKPVGLEHPTTNEKYHAVIQLRKENIHGTAFNFVGCQTRLKQPDQKRVFKLIPGLEKARFLRFGALHRNTYLDAPNVLDNYLQLVPNKKPIKNTFFAGQITGVEGYVESMACGLITAAIVANLLKNKPLNLPCETTALGGLYRHIRGTFRANTKQKYTPSNINWSMVVPLPKTNKKMPRAQKREALSKRALQNIKEWVV